MPTNIAVWLTEPGTDVLCTDNQWINQVISCIDEDKWFEALELGIFAEEWNRLKELAWVSHIALAHSWGHVERDAGG